MGDDSCIEDSQVFVVTGCSSGLGLSIVRALLQDVPSTSHKVIATSRDLSKTPELVAEIESKGGAWLVLDTSSSDLENQFQAVNAVYGHVDVLINNAGISKLGPFEYQHIQDAREILETNFFGPVRLTHALLPQMRQRGTGTIINVSSGAVYHEFPGLALYAASKAALETFTAAIAGEVACFGVKVVATVPGAMPTPISTGEKLKANMVPQPETYKDAVLTAVYDFFGNYEKNARIDTDKAAERIVEAATGTGLLQDKEGSWTRLPIGTDTGMAMTKWGSEFMKNIGRFENVWSSVDYPEAK